jgi:hypothetical protein
MYCKTELSYYGLQIFTSNSSIFSCIKRIRQIEYTQRKDHYEFYIYR